MCCPSSHIQLNKTSGSVEFCSIRCSVGENVLTWLCKFLDTSMRNRAGFFIVFFYSVLVLVHRYRQFLPFSVTAEY